MFHSKGVYSHTNWQLYHFWWHVRWHINQSEIWKWERSRKTRKQRPKGEKVYCVWVLSPSAVQTVWSEVELNTSTMGTLFMVTGTRPDGHVLKWQSQPLVRDIRAGNLLVAAAILFCSLTFTGMAKKLNSAMFSESTFYRLCIQREYLFPIVHNNYLMQ